jgi:hypothetical protein
MLRLRPPTSTVPRRHNWPAFSPSEPSTAFSPRPPLRKLVVVIDNELLTGVDDGSADEMGLLGGLLSHPYLQLFRYHDGGPPEDVPRRTHEVSGEFVPGWIVVGEPTPDHLPVVVADNEGTSVVRGGIIGNATRVAEGDTVSSGYPDLSAEDSASRRHADAIAIQAAAVADADVFITERSYLHGVTWDLARGVLVATPHEVLPLISLYLRAQGVFITYRGLDGRGTVEMNSGLFYWVGTRELLPAGWRWFTACVQHAADDDTFIYLGQSVFHRVQRALQARDAAHCALNQPPDNDTASEALNNLDLVLLGLMAGLDVTARVAHRSLGLGGSERRAAWQRDQWLRRVEETAPELAAVVAAGSRGAHALTILNALRNSIHGAALDALSVGSSIGRRADTLVGLPHAEADELVSAMDELGGRELFGVRQLLPDRIHADPGLLLDALFSRALELLDELMRLTPVERLEGVSIAPEHHHPPSDGGFDEWSRTSIRWQLGLR